MQKRLVSESEAAPVRSHAADAARPPAPWSWRKRLAVALGLSAVLWFFLTAAIYLLIR